MASNPYGWCPPRCWCLPHMIRAVFLYADHLETAVAGFLNGIDQCGLSRCYFPGWASMAVATSACIADVGTDRSRFATEDDWHGILGRSRPHRH